MHLFGYLYEIYVLYSLQIPHFVSNSWLKQLHIQEELRKTNVIIV
jgi:hypothetical protein